MSLKKTVITIGIVCVILLSYSLLDAQATISGTAMYGNTPAVGARILVFISPNFSHFAPIYPNNETFADATGSWELPIDLDIYPYHTFVLISAQGTYNLCPHTQLIRYDTDAYEPNVELHLQFHPEYPNSFYACKYCSVIKQPGL